MKSGDPNCSDKAKLRKPHWPRKPWRIGPSGKMCPTGKCIDESGMVIDFEPIASIGGQGYYLEDMYLIGKTGAEVLTPGVP